MTTSATPRFSLVSAAYGVARFLDDFIASVEAQTFPLDRVEVIMVDDGSVDGSAEVIRAWAARRPELVTVLSQANGGQAAARNTGLAHATGEWVSFPDPDDALSDRYLEKVDSFLNQHRDVDLVAANRWIWNESSGRTTNTHPLRHLFQRDRLVDLTLDNHYFHGSSNAAFFRRDRIEADAIRFDTRLRPAFEDGHFTTRYLLAVPSPRVGFLQSARYLYRKRQDGTSTLQTSRTHPGRYREMFELGFLDLIDHAIKQQGSVPRWLQSYLVYELSWYFTLTDSRAPAGVPTTGPTAERAHALIRETLAHLDLPEVVERSMLRLQRITRYVLLHGYAPHAWHEPFVLLTELDHQQQLVQATYFFTGEPPEEEVLVDGRPAQALHAKSVAYTFLGQTLLRRRVLWLPASGSVAVRLDGRPMDLVFRRPEFPIDVAGPVAIRHHIGDGAKVRRQLERPRDPVPTREGRRAWRLRSRAAIEQRYRRAWVLMDRVDHAADSAEVLFKHLRARHGNINAWFVLEKGTLDWHRLHQEGYGDRLVAHGSMAWRTLMAHAVHLISSHADDAIIRPAAITEFTRPGWRFHYLNQGVITDDVSAWLNRLPIASMVTSTPAEHAAIAGDSPYTLSTREVRLTGLPRLDRLLEDGGRFGPDQRDLLLVAPTWHGGRLPQPWCAVLESPALRTEAQRHGVTVALLAGPDQTNDQTTDQATDQRFVVPDHVELLARDVGRLGEYLARARVLVTDHSADAFDAAYLLRPVVYHHVDDEVGVAGAAARRGYFDYHRDGFGPVTQTPREAVQATIATLEHAPAPAEPYLSRMTAAFPRRDGRCSERVFRAIRSTVRDRTQDAPQPTPVQRRASTR